MLEEMDVVGAGSATAEERAAGDPALPPVLVPGPLEGVDGRSGGACGEEVDDGLGGEARDSRAPDMLQRER